MINTTYKQLADYIFYFPNAFSTPGKGLFLFRSLDAIASKQNKTQMDINVYHIVIFNLIDNGYLEVSNGLPFPFVKLTDKGYDYLQGDFLIKNQINLENYIDLSTANNIDSIFIELWMIIGKKDYAPFYVDGPTFFKAINPFVKVSTSYSTYIDMLSDNKESTSRISWFKKLFKQLKKTDLPLFLKDLSNYISLYYEEKDSTNESQEVIIYPTSNLNMIDNKSAALLKKVFISYCWENDEHTKWVHTLAKNLEKANFEVIIDKKQPLGIDLNRFMEKTIADVDKILIIVTPEYKKRADDRVSGVGYETLLITADLIKDQNRIKFIPIIRYGDMKSSYPHYLGNIKGLLMTDKDDYTKALDELFSNLRNY